MEFQFFVMLASVLSAYGLAIILVEKGSEWPVRKYNLILRRLVRNRIDVRAGKVFLCTVCMSFWTTLFTDLVCLLMFGYFFWPLSGFITLGFTWFVIQLLNAIENSNENAEV
tara:strand:- start:3290 stop:3625 length:336 start_codon:yes stop_codon:yes gene_type:complete